ncbi:MAG: AIR synthase [Chloroflexi bacterium]|nr:MAG: AIR synthase [Chloroflexota bacterium]
MTENLPLGKLPFDLLARLLSQAPIKDTRVLYGPGIGLDCAVIDLGERLLVFKSDPITFATDDIGWYAVQINANDIATTGAEPRWMLATLLLPENATSQPMVENIFDQIYRAAAALNISVVGGHTEVTYDLHRPVLVGTLIGEVDREHLITPDSVRPGDRLLLTKGVPIEGTALLAREFPHRLAGVLSEAELVEARHFLYNPGISVVRDARIATQAGKVHAMHDPTEGGLAGAIWELAQASQHSLVIDPGAVLVPDISRKICTAFNIDPLNTIASGALLMAVASADAEAIRAALESEGIASCEIGQVNEGPAGVWRKDGAPLPRPLRDDIARVYEDNLS